MRPAMTCALVILASALVARAEGESLGVEVDRAIERGVARLRKSQNPDGSFQGPQAAQYPAGVTALALYALVKSQASGDDPTVKKAVEFVRQRPLQKTYEVATSILALDALKDPAQDEWIRTAAKWIEDHVVEKEGVWSYPFGPNADFSKTDLSNTQFAVLGLWTAERHGYKAKRELWTALAERLPGYQTSYGAFLYSTNRGSPDGSGSMTTAGLTVLTLALERVPPNDKEKPYVERAAKCIKKAWEYLEQRFTVESDLEGAFASRTNGHAYFLYGLERVAALTRREKIAGRDWYREGARALVGIQDPDGAWYGATEETCFALLFLRKATTTQMGNEGPEFLEGEGLGAKAPSRKPPAADVPFVLRWLVLGPFPNPDDSALSDDALKESYLAPRAGTRTGKATWSAYQSPGPFLSFHEAVGAKDHTLSYAFAYLHAQLDTDVVLWFDHDDGARILLDGKVIHERHFHEGSGPDRKSLPVHLSAGAHRLLFKVEEWVGGTGVFLRIARPDGSDALEVVPTISPSPPEAIEALRLRPDVATLNDLLALLPVDPIPTLEFSEAADLDRVFVARASPGWPRWFAKPEARANQPHPDAVGFIAVHPKAQDVPAQVVRKVRLPGGLPFLRMRISADPYEDPSGPSDFVLRVAVYDGTLYALRSEVIEAGPPSPDGWKTIDVDLRDFAGREVLLVADFAAGGKRPWNNEEAFLDKMTIGTASR